MIKEKYLIVGHMWWCSLVVGKGTREAKVVGSNPGNGRKNRKHIRAKKRGTCDLRRERGGKKKIFFIFIHTKNIYFNTQKNDTRQLFVDIGDGLRLP